MLDDFLVRVILVAELSSGFGEFLERWRSVGMTLMRRALSDMTRQKFPDNWLEKRCLK